jgi:DNA adenine methylase
MPVPEKPLLKWTGGKRWASVAIASLAPQVYGRYFEPFLGGGAVFFHLRAWPATLSDVNADLINAYSQIRDAPNALYNRLAKMKISEDAFYAVRASSPRSALTKAARLIYLNRVAFNGIYRVNRSGQFNVPYGCKPGTTLPTEEELLRASQALARRSIKVLDFEDALDAATRGDLVYADPPYTNKHNDNGFRRYNEQIFSWSDQVRLAAACHRAVKRGVSVIVSNANHAEVAQLYSEFSSRAACRYSGISGRSLSRGVVTEKIFYRVQATP